MEKTLTYKGVIIAIIVTLNFASQKYDVYQDWHFKKEYTMKSESGVTYPGQYLRSFYRPLHKIEAKVNSKSFAEITAEGEELTKTIRNLTLEAQDKIDYETSTIEGLLIQQGFTKKE